MVRPSTRSRRGLHTEMHRRQPPPALTPSWDDPINRALAQMLTSPDPLQRAIATRLILSDAAKSHVLH